MLSAAPVETVTDFSSRLSIKDAHECRRLSKKATDGPSAPVHHLDATSRSTTLDLPSPFTFFAIAVAQIRSLRRTKFCS
jgi:hypothetical protein